MKKLRLFLMMLTLAVTSVTFSSCSDDSDDGLQNPLVGTWVSESGNTTYTFKSNGTGTYVYEEMYEGITISEKSNFTYIFSLSENLLKISHENSSYIENYQAIITGKTLMLTWTDSEGTWTQILYKK